MTTYPYQPVPLSILNDAMREEFRTIVVRRALDGLDQAASQVRRQFQAELRRHVKLPGFTDPSRALHSPKRAALLAGLVSASHYSNALMGTILQLWDQSQMELHQAVLTFLQNSDDPIKEPAHIDTEFPFIWPSSHMLSVRDEFRLEHPSFDEDDVALMFCYISGRAPMPDDMIERAIGTALPGNRPGTESQGETQSPAPPSFEGTTEKEASSVTITSPLFRDTLSQLKDLPADAAEWEQAPMFLDMLRALVQQKLAEREQMQIQLREALIVLTREACGPLTWWGYDVSTWSADRCHWNQATALAQQVQQWQAVLLKHAALRLAPADSRTEEKAHRKDLASLETDIERGYAELHLALSPETPGPIAPSGADTTSPKTSVEPADEEQQQAQEIIELADASSAESANLADLLVEQASPEVSAAAVLEVLPAEPDLPETAPTDIGALPHHAEGTDQGERSIEPAIGDETTASAEATSTYEEALPKEPISNREWLDQEDGTTDAGVETTTSDLQLKQSTGTGTLPEEVQDKTAFEMLGASENDTDEAWHALLWIMISEDDLPGAYWLVKSFSVTGRPTSIPDWLLASAQAARWVSEDTAGLARDLFQISRDHSIVENTPPCEMLALAAALHPALVAPASGMISWLNTPTACPALRKLVLAIQNFAAYGIGLHREDALGIAGQEQRDEAIEATSREAWRWLQEAPIRRKRVSSVWRSLVGAHGALKVFLTPVCENRQEKLDAVRAELPSWQNRSTVYARFDDINVSGSPGRPERVAGAGKHDLYREVERAVELAERWCNLVDRARKLEARWDWFRDQVTVLRGNVEQELPDAEAALKLLNQDTQAASLAAAACVLQTSLNQVRELLNLPQVGDRSDSADFSRWLLPGATDSLEAMLADRLLWLPEVSLNDSGLPTAEGLPLVARALRTARLEGRTLPSAVDRWLAQQDYRFFDRLARALAIEATMGDVQQRYAEALGASRAILRASITETSNLIEQALLDGIINDEERASYGASFASLVVEEVRNFKAKLADLEQIRYNIQHRNQNRLQYLRDQHELTTNRLKASHIPAERQREAMTFIASALERKDVTVVVESLAHLQGVLDTGADLPDGWYAPASNRDYLEEFNAASPHMEVWLKQTHDYLRVLAGAVRDGATTAGLQFGRLGEPRRKEAAEALLSWRTLKQQAAKGNNAPSIAAILRYLNFDLKTDASVQILNLGTDWLHARALMSASDPRPIPEFGSQAQGRYDVICLWERPGADTIAARLRDLNLDIHTVIVLYLGRITARQKLNVIRVSRDKELAIALLDETLLVFLAQEQDVRLPTFLRCALPFSALNPYRPFQAGDVPPEMFFGREGMAKELQRQGGSCLIYGGRQLGKSALLRHVERQFHHPEREQFAWVENMKLVFDPSAGKTSANVWRNLREGFKAQKLFDSRADKPEEIARQIGEAMRAKPGQRVLVMLDEADEFLDADARDGFRTVISLRELMQTTAQRFKVIFAGLQNVQRFQGIPNQPLAHFGTPLCVGPLEPGEAQLLVRQPLEVLGYRFADDGAVLRILSYTNYHPGLIQYFCQELLKQLRDRSSTALPPYQIRQEDIEAIYRAQPVRDRIRERFEWTLALDTHYQAIAWTLIEDQIKDQDGYARAYPPSDVLQLVREWWPAGFIDTNNNQLRGWLDELCGLGVLVRNAKGHYRLRSPNMVRLLGKETDINDRLLELMTKPPALITDADSHHALLDDKVTRYSPLTYAEERSLYQPRFGVGVVFASEALGLSLLPAAIRRFLPVDLPAGTGDCSSIPAEVTAKYLDEWLGKHLKLQVKTERMILYQQIERQVASTALAELVNVAQHFCQRHQAKDRWLRILFLFDPQFTGQWLGLPATEWRRLEEAADAALWPRPWTLSAIRRRLAQHDKLDTDDVGSIEVLRVTGGWPYLLDDLFTRCGKETDLRPAAREIEQELTDRDSKLARDFRSRLGIMKNEVAQRVLTFVLDEGDGKLPEELLTPEMVGGNPELTGLQCNQAKEFLLRFGLLHLESETLKADPIIARLMAAK